MLKDKRLFTITLIGLFMCGVFSSTPVFAQNDSSVPTQRIYGSDRFETSVAISKEGWVQADTVIIASGLDYPDALVATPLSKLKDAPILLSTQNALQPTTLTEITRLKATKAIIVGGTGVLSTDVENQLKTLKVAVTRIAGIDRYDTSKKVAELIGVSHGIIISSGFDFPDPLCIAPVAAIKGMPILLTSQNSLNSNIASFIKGKSIPVSYLVGGIGVLSASIESKVPNSKRLSGANRYATGKIINIEFAKLLNFDKVYVASGINFPDALSGSALAAKNDAPLFLSEQDQFGYAFYSLNIKKVIQAVILGGEGAISKGVESNFDSYLYESAVKTTSLSLNKTAYDLTIGDTASLLATVYPESATYKAVNFYSTNSEIATVDDTGKIIAVSAGTVTIDAYNNGGPTRVGPTGDCFVTVSPASVSK